MRPFWRSRRVELKTPPRQNGIQDRGGDSNFILSSVDEIKIFNWLQPLRHFPIRFGLRVFAQKLIGFGTSDIRWSVVGVDFKRLSANRCSVMFSANRHSTAPLPCFPFQYGQKGQSPPTGKSSPSSCGHPMFPSLATTDFTSCREKNSLISRRTFGFSWTPVPTHRSKIGSAPSEIITDATIFVVVLSSSP